ncbi:binding-protein-dependent transport systems inner membrane component [Beutenbergia cavernae DSM 12333]|uniref:Binding-protein-dependent transport systems inner membrane component n=1 Tax=Beutenbergia cavernae (strain ATCC BAA-8 / DSM 12333 / CCUG 43141 / JCM 11478 / NBRC 16432 / NCIMB 13614 / HKI 0122) TaxID=471853 RepID=C5BZR7_BEUC1|nr:sugar ABC transporter permease [Beutenbergia cavernae]ACQ81247.1 binding-protein-dependent transport systems inner membrane component [Beutenbergia cavernae DSM 12333]
MVTATATAPAARAVRGAKEHRRPWSARERRQLRLGLLFISPWLVGVLVFVLYPLVYSLVISLTRYSGMQTPVWVGLGNYITAFADPLTGISVRNTLFYAGLAVPIGLVVALVLAMAMNRNVREVAVYRTALYVPSLVPAFAMSFIFIVFVNPQFGLFNQVLSIFGGENVNLLGEPTTAKIVIVLMAQLGAGNAALIYLAGLRNIPVTLYEAARVDGASAWRQFRSITLPLLSPVILFNLITGISGALQIFTEAYVLTNGAGGPDNGTLFYMLYLYKNAFSYAQLGYASALAVLLFVVGIALAGLVYWLSRRFVHYDVSAG